MYGVLARGLTLLLWVFVAGVALVWYFVEQYPTLAAITIPSVAALACWAVRSERARKAAIADLRMRDEHVPSMSPREYEQFAARQLERAGWRVTHCGRQGDQGADVVGELRGFRAVVQVKKYSGRCGNGAIQEVVAARRHYAAQIVAVVAPNGFTRSAVELAATNGVHLLHHGALHTLEGAARVP